MNDLKIEILHILSKGTISMTKHKTAESNYGSNFPSHLQDAHEADLFYKSNKKLTRYDYEDFENACYELAGKELVEFDGENIRLTDKGIGYCDNKFL